MNCDLYKHCPSERVAGFHEYRCRRTGCPMIVHSPYEPDRIDGAECVGIPRWHEFGNWVDISLQVFGITKPRWAWLTRQKDTCCTCPQRQEKLNSLGHKLALLLSGLFGRFRNLVNRYFARSHNRKADPPT